MQQNLPDLKPCPFCGGGVMLTAGYVDAGRWVEVSCSNHGCRAIGPAGGPTWAEAGKAWNARINTGDAVSGFIEEALQAQPSALDELMRHAESWPTHTDCPCCYGLNTSCPYPEGGSKIANQFQQLRDTFANLHGAMVMASNYRPQETIGDFCKRVSSFDECGRILHSLQEVLAAGNNDEPQD